MVTKDKCSHTCKKIIYQTPWRLYWEAHICLQNVLPISQDSFKDKSGDRCSRWDWKLEESSRRLTSSKEGGTKPQSNYTCRQDITVWEESVFKGENSSIFMNHLLEDFRICYACQLQFDLMVKHSTDMKTVRSIFNNVEDYLIFLCGLHIFSWPCLLIHV